MRKKLKLNTDSLRVDSFEVDGVAQAGKGTVRGAMDIQTVTTCEQPSWDVCQSGPGDDFTAQDFCTFFACPYSWNCPLTTPLRLCH